ncbi:histidinol-phosphate transaminase [Pseudaquabacterium pictum]|uniref:Histidinol-phosphate aminotransferase n=1 Tax=Pseudaquabacterium pictum TaxID=2315236 RepID=A0A480AT65_9BURK|nr:histidinol-phosphate transaminase [Rubrivivax pictus]GCL64156.1 histidinol-phosphate aminotransferase 1 [Rubrivivax pictus]
MTDLLTATMARVVRADIQGLHAYAVQPSAGFVKVDTMENPHPLPPALQQALGERLGRVAIHRYPAERGDDLKAALAAHAGLPAGCSLMLGNGSDELITLLSMACALPGAVFMSPLPSFVMYGLSAALQGVRFEGVPLTADFELNEAAMLAAIDQHRPALLYLACPNNPTGNLWDEAVIDRIVDAMARHQGLVVIDEAYQPFAARDAMHRLGRQPHVLVMRTMSKFGLAGVRIGYLMGASALIAEIDKLRPPFNISVLNAEAALFALAHADEYARQAVLIREQRERLFRALQDMPGVHPWASQANMVLARVPDAAATFAGMKARGVLIKNVSALHPLLANCLRITVGTPDEVTLTLAALRASL